jgi:hypothetical protein
MQKEVFGYGEREREFVRNIGFWGIKIVGCHK